MKLYIFAAHTNDARRVNKNRIIGIDLGIRNIVTIANNIGNTPIVVKGSILKSINQFYNKNKAKLQSIYDNLNIIRKAIPDAFAKGIEGVVLHPIRVNYLKTRSYNL